MPATRGAEALPPYGDINSIILLAKYLKKGGEPMLWLTDLLKK
jgi:hypothetical protein